MALHFSREELAERRARAGAEMARQGLHGLLLFRQESLYYLTGYDTGGYSMFQAMYLGADGGLALLARSADLRQAEMTSVVTDIRIWVDREDANPAEDVRRMLDDYGGRGKRIGVEYHAYGLTAQRGQLVDATLAGFCDLVDASDLVRLQRLVKSPAELAYVRRAGALADEALAVANRMTVPGASLGAVFGAMTSAILAGGGDPSASRWPVGRGREALLVRYHTGMGTVAARDQVTFEFAAAYRHYHAALMHAVVVGGANDRQRRMFDACRTALEACQAKLRAGNTVAEVFDAHVAAFQRTGFAEHILNACGYTLGATYPPSWMDWPMVYAGNPQVLAPDMVFFLHMILVDAERGLAMSLGETAIVTEGACEPVSHAPRTLVVT